MASASSILKKLFNLKGGIIDSCEFVEETKSFMKEPFVQEKLLIHVHPTKNEQKRCPICGRECPAYDHKHETESHWRTTNCCGFPVFFCYRPTRICCPEHGVLTERIPWADGKSRFTPEFNNEIAWMAGQCSKSALSIYFSISWETVGNCIKAAQDRLEPDVSQRLRGLRRICVDETSYRKGHAYITVVYDMDRSQVVWVSENHGKEVFKEFCEQLTTEERAAIEIVAGDGASWITSCTEEYFPNAIRCLDFFHSVEWVNEALDHVRVSVAAQATREYNTKKEEFKIAENKVYEEEQKTKKMAEEARAKLSAMPTRGRPSAEKTKLLNFLEEYEAFLADRDGTTIEKSVGRPRKEQFTPEHQKELDQLQAAARELKGAKYALGHDPHKCTANQKQVLALIQANKPDLYRAYEMKETFRVLTHMSDVEAAEIALDKWIEEAKNSGLKPFEELSDKILRHRQNLLNSISTGCNSAQSEATNTTIKVMIRMAHGFRNLENLKALIYLRCSDTVVPLNNRPQMTAKQAAAERQKRNETRRLRKEMLRVLMDK